MKTSTTVRDMQRWSDEQRALGKRVGFVPTMGALHEGHLSLVDRAHAVSDVVAASIFVNPTQFAPNEDFDSYPRTFEDDCRALGERDVSAVFAPDVAEMYPPGFATSVSVQGITSVLEGATRPTHFAGVALVVAKLLLAAKPHVAIFGRKDAQQALVLQRMTRDLNMDVAIDVAPTAREADGLAMSSRNRYLSSDDRAAAGTFPQALRAGFEAWLDGERNASAIVEIVDSLLSAEPRIRRDYLEVVAQDTLRRTDLVGPGTLVAGAVFLGTTRLIDNWWVTTDGTGEF